ncbi:hypothetical protein GLGCALEP_02119 [Pseudomonas sp. MM221]|nr:hypothetical protein DBADOPDK_02066 [Pseudomonas sp. MM223]CAI3799004.1 hypothetical protein GLGCALEP_02119 [Pseudomonas sp. MM221]
MKTERRALEDWEVEECLALKAELNDYNKRVPREKRLTQEEIADRLGMSQGTLSSHLNGKRAINVAMASRLANMLGIDVSAFSPRLAGYIEEISRGYEAGQAAAAHHLAKISGPLGAKSGGMVGAVLGASTRVFREAGLSSGKGLEGLENDIPLTYRVRQIKEVLSPLKGEQVEDLFRSVVGVSFNPRQVLELLDSILEAAACNAIDIDEIEAITTLVRKRRNEKIHGVAHKSRSENGEPS